MKLFENDRVKKEIYLINHKIVIRKYPNQVRCIEDFHKICSAVQNNKII